MIHPSRLGCITCNTWYTKFAAIKCSPLAGISPKPTTVLSVSWSRVTQISLLDRASREPFSSAKLLISVELSNLDVFTFCFYNFCKQQITFRVVFSAFPLTSVVLPRVARHTHARCPAPVNRAYIMCIAIVSVCRFDKCASYGILFSLHSNACRSGFENFRATCFCVFFPFFFFLLQLGAFSSRAHSVR